jgi:DNA-binding transcriptional LysR family regulator
LILSQLNEAKQKIHKSSKEAGWSISVGSTPLLTKYLLSPMVRRFVRSHPSAKVRVIEDLQVRLLPALRSGLLDLALVHLPIGGREFRTESLMQQSLYVAVPKNHSLAGRKQVRLAEFRQDAGPRFGIREIVIEARRSG